MKQLYLLPLLIVLLATAPVLPQKKGKTVRNQAAPKVDPAMLLGTWWVKHDMGSMDGYQLEPDGNLVLVNLYAWSGDSWTLRGDTMTWVMHAEGQDAETASYIVSELTGSTMGLTPITDNAGTKTIVLRKHTGSHAADTWAGRWRGRDADFIDLIPIGGSYKIVINRAGALEEFSGMVDSGGVRFTTNRGSGRITHISGKDSGLPWLETKQSCLLLDKKEGFYRD